jgi:hypothetical protein
MTAVKNPEEVYRKYLDRFGLDGDGDPDALALFTFALVERDKFDWLEHHRCEHGGADPAPHIVEQWYASKPESYFEDKFRQALGWYTSFARVLLKDEIEKSNQDAIRLYVGDKLKFWPQIGTGLVGNILFLCVLGILSAAIFTDFSPIAWVRRHTTGMEITNPPTAHPSSPKQPD